MTKPTRNIVYNIGDKIIAGSLQLIPYQFARRLTNSTEPFFHFALSANYYYNRASF